MERRAVRPATGTEAVRPRAFGWRQRDGRGVSVALLPRAEVRGLDAARTAALDRGEVAARGDFEIPQAYARLGGEDRVLAFTLPGSSYPFARGRGLLTLRTKGR